MRTNMRRGPGALTLVVLTAAVSLSGRVEAQQTGLLPLAPIRRQRVPCDREDPTYKIYKQQYFGYHPTGWRQFPAGWGWPSPEAPDFERSKRELPPGHATEEEAGEGGSPFDEVPAPRRRPAAGEIGLPPDRSPFEQDAPGAAPNVNPLPRGNAPRTTPPPRLDDPFDVPNAPPGAAPRPRNDSQTRTSPPAPAGAAPELAAPTRGSVSRSGRDDAESEEPAAAGEGPLLGLSDSDLIRSDSGASLPESPADASAVPAGELAPVDVAAAPAPVPQPRRRFFANLFSGLGSNWLRR